MALVGDAAYGPSPMAGVGTSLALVGAYVLAGELAAAAGDHHTAFASYQQELRDYVGKGQKLAKGNAVGLIPRSRSQSRLRNLSRRLLGAGQICSVIWRWLSWALAPRPVP